MPTPSQIQAIKNSYLTQVAQGYVPDGFICDQVAPPVPVLTKSGQYLVHKNGLVIYDTTRALNTKAKQIDFGYSYDKYALDEHSLSHLVDLETIAAAEEAGLQEQINVKDDAAKTLTRMLYANKEKAMADVIAGTGYYQNDNKLALTSTAIWDDYEHSDPIGDIKAARSQVRNCIGMYPNTAVMGADTWEILRDHPALVSYFKNQMGSLTMDQVKQVLGIKNIIIGEGIYNAGDTMTNFWGDMFALLPVPSVEELRQGYPAFVMNLVLKNGTQVLGPVDEGEVLRFIEKWHWQIKHISNKNGFLITNTKTA